MGREQGLARPIPTLFQVVVQRRWGQCFRLVSFGKHRQNFLLFIRGCIKGFRRLRQRKKVLKRLSKKSFGGWRRQRMFLKILWGCIKSLRAFLGLCKKLHLPQMQLLPPNIILNVVQNYTKNRNYVCTSLAPAMQYAPGSKEPVSLRFCEGIPNEFWRVVGFFPCIQDKRPSAAPVFELGEGSHPV